MNEDRQPLTLEAMELLGFRLLCPLGPGAFNMDAVIRISHDDFWFNEFRLLRNTGSSHTWAMDDGQHNMGHICFSYMDEIVPLISVLRGKDGIIVRDGHASIIPEYQKLKYPIYYNEDYLNKKFKYQ